MSYSGSNKIYTFCLDCREVLLTFEGEKMYIETIFRETLNGEEYLYWYSVQGTGGIEVTETEHWIDKKHLAYWKECIDESYIR